MKRERSKYETPQATWLATYGDMVTLLMTFFILLFALSTLNQKKFEKITYSLQASFGGSQGSSQVVQGSTGVLKGGTTDAQIPISKEEAQLIEVQQKVDRYIEESGLRDVISVQADPRGILIRFRDQVLFDLGRADLKDQSKHVLDRICDAVSVIPNDVRIEGHTDDLPINTSRFPTNWDLSAARAVAVLQYMNRNAAVQPDRLSIAGYGEHRPVASNSTDQGRRLNRRVDIVILTMDLSRNEPKSQGK